MLHNATRALCLLGFVLFFPFAACSSPAGADWIPVVQLSRDSVTLAVGDTFQAALLPVLPPGYVPDVHCSSSAPTTATVSPTGRTSAAVAGLWAGHAVIHVAGDGSQDSLRVTVIAN